MNMDSTIMRADTRARDRMFAWAWLTACLAMLGAGAMYLKYGIPPHVSEVIVQTQDPVPAITWPSLLVSVLGILALLAMACCATPRFSKRAAQQGAWIISGTALATVGGLGTAQILGPGFTILAVIIGLFSLVFVGFTANRSVKNYLFTYTATTVALASVVMLGVLLTSIISQGWGRVNNLNLEVARQAMGPQKLSRFSELETQVHWPRLAVDLNMSELVILDKVDWTKVAQQAGVYFAQDMDEAEFEIIRDEQGIEDLPIFTNDQWRAVYDQLRIPGMGAIEAHWKSSDLGRFLTSPPSRHADKAGIGPALWGTVWVCLVCGVVALPLGVGTAIFLEEFRPRNPVLARLRNIVQLNIANLAGVPSIVYGIIGLTAFVSVFEFGNPNAPDLTIGDTVYDEVRDLSGTMLRIERPSQSSDPVELSSGLIAIDENTGLELTVTVFSPSELPDTPTPGDVAADANPQRRVERSWYYLQLPFGRGVLAGGLTLMLVILPVVIISSQESLRAVPDSLRQAAMAIGTTRWQMISRMTLPAAVPGIMTGSILAMSRAIGEAAPILILAGIVFITFNPQHLMDDFTAMPLQIYDWAGRPQLDFHASAAAGIIVLLAVLLSFNALAILIRHKYQKPLQ